jgi:hypothetical protein
MKFFSKISLLLTLLATTANAGNLRSTTRQEQDRNLQAATVVNALITTLTPALVGIIQDNLDENVDPIFIGNETTLESGELEVPFPGQNNNISSLCKSSASVTYGLGELWGLSSININRLELVPGSETIEMAMLGLGGVKWNGTWLLNATFANLTAETSVTASASACGFPLQTTLTGTTTMLAPSLQATLRLGGETSNIILFTSTSQIKTAQVETLDIELGPVEANIATSASIIPALNFGQSLDAFLLNELGNQLEPLLVQQLNQALGNQMPFAVGQW